MEAPICLFKVYNFNYAAEVYTPMFREGVRWAFTVDEAEKQVMYVCARIHLFELRAAIAGVTAKVKRCNYKDVTAAHERGVISAFNEYACPHGMRKKVACKQARRAEILSKLTEDELRAAGLSADLRDPSIL